MFAVSKVSLLDCGKRFTQSSNLAAHEKSHLRGEETKGKEKGALSEEEEEFENNQNAFGIGGTNSVSFLERIEEEIQYPMRVETKNKTNEHTE